MLYAIMTNDKPDSLDLRMATREDHLAFLNGLGDQLKFAGPFLDEDEKPNGSLVVIEAKDAADARALAAQDPYAKAGLFSDVTVRPWKWSLKNPDAA